MNSSNAFMLKAKRLMFPRVTLSYINRSFSLTSAKNADVDVKVENGIRTVTLNRPQKRNAITGEMFKAISSALNESNSDDNTAVVVITGAGELYTGGIDLAIFANVTDAKASALQASGYLTTLVKSLINCRKPIVALVNGPAIGVGVTTLGLCDVVYASDKATFVAPFTSLGLVAEACSSYTFPRIMGYAKATEVLSFTHVLTATEAEQSGLVTRVFPHEKFQEESWKLLNVMGKLPIKSLMYSKDLVRGRERELLHQTNEAENQRLIERWQSEDFFTAISKFFTKKPK